MAQSQFVQIYLFVLYSFLDENLIHNNDRMYAGILCIYLLGFISVILGFQLSDSIRKMDDKFYQKCDRSVIAGC